MSEYGQWLDKVAGIPDADLPHNSSTVAYAIKAANFYRERESAAVAALNQALDSLKRDQRARGLERPAASTEDFYRAESLAAAEIHQAWLEADREATKQLEDTAGDDPTDVDPIPPADTGQSEKKPRSKGRQR